MVTGWHHVVNLAIVEIFVTSITRKSKKLINIKVTKVVNDVARKDIGCWIFIIQILLKKNFVYQMLLETNTKLFYLR